jgi:hypothetical protein
VNFLLEWLGEHDKNTHKKCIQFATCISSLSARKLMISGSELEEQAILAGPSFPDHLVSAKKLLKRGIYVPYAVAFVRRPSL